MYLVECLCFIYTFVLNLKMKLEVSVMKTHFLDKIESMETFTNEISLRLSQAMDSIISMIHSQNNKAISSEIAERIIPEIQNMLSSLFSGNRDTESGSSSNNPENND